MSSDGEARCRGGEVIADRGRGPCVRVRVRRAGLGLALTADGAHRRLLLLKLASHR